MENKNEKENKSELTVASIICRGSTLSILGFVIGGMIIGYIIGTLLKKYYMNKN